MTLCLVFRIFDVFDILPFHNIVYCIIACANLKYHLSIVIFEEPLTAYYAIWQTIVADLATQVQTRSQCKGVQAQILNPKRHVASQAYLYLWSRPQHQESNQSAVILLIKTKQCSIIYIFHLTICQLQDQVYCLVGIICQSRHNNWIPTRKIKNLHRMLV